MIVDKRVVVVLLFGLCMWYIGGARILGLRELVDACLMAELISRTFKHKR
jgi:hypothetical protein